MSLAKGEADRFLKVLGVYQDWPAITRRRMHFETLNKILPGRRKYVKPPSRTAGEFEIWFVEPQVAGALSLQRSPGTK